MVQRIPQGQTRQNTTFRTGDLISSLRRHDHQQLRPPGRASAPIQRTPEQYHYQDPGAARPGDQRNPGDPPENRQQDAHKTPFRHPETACCPETSELCPRPGAGANESREPSRHSTAAAAHSQRQAQIEGSTDVAGSTTTAGEQAPGERISTPPGTASAVARSRATKENPRQVRSDSLKAELSTARHQARTRIATQKPEPNCWLNRRRRGHHQGQRALLRDRARPRKTRDKSEATP